MLRKLVVIRMVLSLVLSTMAFVPGIAYAADPSATQTQIKNLDDQMTAIRLEMTQLSARRLGLLDQIAYLRLQKRIDALRTNNQNLMVQIQNAQKSKQAPAYLNDLLARQGLLQQEIFYQQDILSLYMQLQSAHTNQQADLVSTTQKQIQEKWVAISKLYVPKVAPTSVLAPISYPTAVPRNPTPVPSNPIATPVPHPATNPVASNPVSNPVYTAPAPVMIQPTATPVPEEPAIQSVLDQIKGIDEQIRQDTLKLQDLQKQEASLRAETH
jgi:hypothetical protein